MNESSSACAQLVRQAQNGDRPSMETLAELVRERVYPYVRRVLLDEHKSEDLVQDISVSILQSLSTLKQADRFWSWVFAIATNKIRERFRRESGQRVVSISDVGDASLRELPGNSDYTSDGMTHVWRQELVQRTQEAMRRLSERQRMVLSLRFYENMAHGDVAQVMGCTELTARVTFFQAKRALTSHLRRMGIDKSAFVAALAAFGHLTLAPKASAATVVVSSAAVEEGLITGLLTAKLKVACVLLTATVVAATLWMPAPASDGTSSPPPRQAAGLHFVHQSLIASSAPLDFKHTRSQGAYEHWFQFPEGEGGPFLFRMQRWDPTQKQKLCWWVQDGDANYYVHSGERVIYVNNARLTRGNYSTTILPSDPEPFCAFIEHVEGSATLAMVNQAGLEYERDPASGRVSKRIDRRFESLGPFETVYDYGEQDSSLFVAPSGLPVKDHRDEMHKRGWTYFRVAGRIGGKGVAGTGRIPFTYNASRTHPARMQLSLDGEQVAADDGHRAVLRAPGGKQEILAGLSLFRGLGRTWSGFHTLDVIRRDAAAERIWYSTVAILPDTEYEVGIRMEEGGVRYAASYTVNMEADVVENVELWTRPDRGGERFLGMLNFSYLQEVDESSPEFAMPDLDVEPSAGAVVEPGLLWMFRLAGDALEERSQT